MVNNNRVLLVENKVWLDEVSSFVSFFSEAYSGKLQCRECLSNRKNGATFKINPNNCQLGGEKGGCLTD